MTELPGIVIYGPPRTKKNHGRIVTMTPKGEKRRWCQCCKRLFGQPRMLPSEQYETWELEALAQCVGIKAQLRSMGIETPIAGLISIEAQIYRQTETGDANGYYQAIGDMLQKAQIIINDSQIEDWDGSRRLKDPARPRVEIYITVIEPRAVQETLPLAK